MGFHIESTEKKHIAIIRVEGEVDMFTSTSLRDTLMLYFDKKKVAAVVVDLAGVSFMDSSGIATLVEGLQWSRKKNRSFVLAGLGDTVYNALSLTKLDNVFSIHENADKAFAAVTRKNLEGY